MIVFAEELGICLGAMSTKVHSIQTYNLHSLIVAVTTYTIYDHLHIHPELWEHDHPKAICIYAMVTPRSLAVAEGRALVSAWIKLSP